MEGSHGEEGAAMQMEKCRFSPEYNSEADVRYMDVGQQCPGLHLKRGSQQGEGGNCSPQLCSCEYCVQIQGPQHKKDVELLEVVQMSV